MNASQELRSKLWEKTNGHCSYCGIKLYPFKGWQIDHFIPIKKGGRDILINLFAACSPCNRLKASKEMCEFEMVMFYKKLYNEYKLKNYPTKPKFNKEQFEFLFWESFFDKKPGEIKLQYIFYFEKLNVLVPFENIHIETGEYILNENGEIDYILAPYRN